jgi:hypothetical protein
MVSSTPRSIVPTSTAANLQRVPEVLHERGVDLIGRFPVRLRVGAYDRGELRDSVRGPQVDGVVKGIVSIRTLSL